MCNIDLEHPVEAIQGLRAVEVVEVLAGGKKSLEE